MTGRLNRLTGGWAGRHCLAVQITSAVPLLRSPRRSSALAVNCHRIGTACPKADKQWHRLCDSISQAIAPGQSL